LPFVYGASGGVTTGPLRTARLHDLQQFPVFLSTNRP
jgi:hypothetical protein